MVKTEKKTSPLSYSNGSALINLKLALYDALSVLGPETQEATLYMMQKRYHIQLEKSRSTDEVYSVLDEMFGIAADIIKERVDANLRETLKHAHLAS